MVLRGHSLAEHVTPIVEKEYAMKLNAAQIEQALGQIEAVSVYQCLCRFA
jgi:hypothetical protein